jgi:thymidylate kinase
MLVAIEGVNGCGKTTLINDITEQLKRMGKRVKVYKFPDRNGKAGKLIDDFLQKKKQFKYKYDMFDAFAKNRAHVLAQISRDLNRNIIVICDRYIASGMAYHIPHDVSDAVLNNYFKILGHFDKDMIVPHKTYLIDGYHLHKRNEAKQIFHHDFVQARYVFETFKRIIPKCTVEHMIVPNRDGRSSVAASCIIHDIIT